MKNIKIEADEASTRRAPFWNGVTFGAAAQTLVTCGAIVAGAPDRLWVPTFIACGAMICGRIGYYAERRWLCRGITQTNEVR